MAGKPSVWSSVWCLLSSGMLGCKAPHKQSHLNQEPSAGVHCCAQAWWSCRFADILPIEAMSLGCCARLPECWPKSSIGLAIVCVCACVHAKGKISTSVLQATLQRFTAAFDDTKAELQARAADTTAHLRAALAKKVDSEELLGFVQVCMHAAACCPAFHMSSMHGGAASWPAGAVPSSILTCSSFIPARTEHCCPVSGPQAQQQCILVFSGQDGAPAGSTHCPTVLTPMLRNSAFSQSAVLGFDVSQNLHGCSKGALWASRHWRGT